MSQDLVKQIVASGSASLQKLAEVAGSTAIHLYTVLVKQQAIEGAITIVQIIIFLVALYWPFKRIYKFIKDYQSDDSIGGGFNWVIGITAGVIYTIALLVLLNVLGGAINQILNPEYYAIRLIFETVKR